MAFLSDSMTASMRVCFHTTRKSPCEIAACQVSWRYFSVLITCRRLAQPSEFVLHSFQFLNSWNRRRGHTNGSNNSVFELGGVSSQDADCGSNEIFRELARCMNGNSAVRAQAIVVIVPHLLNSSLQSDSSSQLQDGAQHSRGYQGFFI